MKRIIIVLFLILSFSNLMNSIFAQNVGIGLESRYSGFLAQEVEKAAKESDYDFSGVHAPRNEHDLYSLTYAEFVVPLVKAVQEQQHQIDELKSTICKL